MKGAFCPGLMLVALACTLCLAAAPGAPVWPVAWQAETTSWNATTGSWTATGLTLPHTLLSDLHLTLHAEHAVLTPAAGGWERVQLTGASWVVAEAAGTSAALDIDLLEVNTDDYQLRVHGYQQTTDQLAFDSIFMVPVQKGDRYGFSTDRVRIKSRQELILIEGFSMTPLLDVRQFGRSLDTAAARMTLDVRRIEVNGADVSDMLQKKSFVADSTVIDGVYFTVDTYGYLPRRAGERRLPHQLLAAAAPNLELGVVTIDNSRVEIQFNHKRRRSGFLSFGDLRATVRNLSNSTYDVPLDLRVDVQTLLYDQGLVDLRFRMPCGTPDGRFWINGRLGAMDFRAVNQVLVTEGNFRVRRGAVDSLLFNIEANDSLATGRAYPYYRNLKARKLRGFKSNQPRRFFSSIMDLLGIPDETPEHGKLIVGHIIHPRDPQQSFFAYCWVALRTGILSVMTPNYLLPDAQESEKTKDF